MEAVGDLTPISTNFTPRVSSIDRVAGCTSFKTMIPVSNARWSKPAVASRGIICLLAQFHGLTTQAPFEVWMAIDEKARLPRIDSPPRIVRFPGIALKSGVQEHVVEGHRSVVYAPRQDRG